MTKKELKAKRESCARRVVNMLSAEDEHSFLEELKKAQELIKFYCDNLEHYEVSKAPWASSRTIYDLVEVLSRLQRRTAEICCDVNGESQRYELLNNMIGDCDAE